MTGIYWLNLAFFLFSSLYFVSRRFDLFSLSFFSVFLYYFPLLLFKSFNVHIYFCVFFVNLMLVVSSSFFSYRFEIKNEGFSKFRFVSILLFSLILFFLNYFYSSSGSSKSEASISIFYYLLLTPLFLSLICSFILNKRKLFLVVFSVYVFFLFTGDRTQIIIAFIGVFFIYINKNFDTLIDFFKKSPLFTLLFLVLFFVFGFLGKAIYGAYFDYLLGRGFWFSISERFAAFLSSPSESIESFHTLSIFEFVANGGDYIGWDYLFHIPAQILPFSLNTGVNSHFIADYIKGAYFSDWTEGAGVSSNFFMEGMLSFGEYGYIVFAILYVFGVIFFSFCTRVSNFYFKVWGLYAGIFWAFYIHRSSLFQMIAHQKRIFYSILIILLLISFLNYLRKKRRS